MRTALRILTAVLALAGAATAQRPPDGYSTVKDRQHGYRFFCPRTYKEIPTQPGDEVLIGRFVRKAAVPTKRSERARRPTSGSDTEIWIVSIPKPVAQPEPPPEEAPTDDPPETEDEKKADAPKSMKEVLARRMEATSFEEFVKKRLPGWRIVSEEDRSTRTARWKEIRLERSRKNPRNPKEPILVSEGIAYLYEFQDHILGLVGTSPVDDFRSRWKGFRTSASSLKPLDAEENLEDLDRHYRMHPEFRDPAFRIERRRGLARGWKAIDTPNFLILHHSKDSKLLARVENDLEAMRLFYEKLFPPQMPVEAVSVVRICKDRKEYLDYGGSARSAGYWNFALEELVLYDNVAGRQGSRFGNRDTYIVLYHEAFHQYIHYSAGEIAPHTWFNEGYGDYFSGTVVYARSTKIKEIRSNPWRVPTIKKAIANGKHVPFDKFLRAEKAEYYRQGPLYYAQGWSLIYFLNESKVVGSRPDWQKITPVYFETLKTVYDEEKGKLAADATLEKKNAAQKRARDKALEAALEGVRVAELEEAWKKYVERYVR